MCRWRLFAKAVRWLADDRALRYRSKIQGHPAGGLTSSVSEFKAYIAPVNYSNAVQAGDESLLPEASR